MKVENKHLTADFGVFQNVSDDSYNRGVKDEYDRFWYACQDGGNRKNYDHAFGGAGWTAQILKPKYDICPTSGYMMFRYCPAQVDLAALLEAQGIRFDMSGCSETMAMFFFSRFTRLPVLDFSSHKSYSAIECFSYCYKLKTIDKLIAPDKRFNNSAFRDCEALEDITFEGPIYGEISFQWSSLLTDASVQSTIHALKNGTATNTLTFHADVGARLTEVQKAEITAKNWTLVY